MAKTPDMSDQTLEGITPMGDPETLYDLGKSIRRFGDIQLGNHLMAHAKAWADQVESLEGSQRMRMDDRKMPELTTINGRRPAPGDVVTWFSYPSGKKTENIGVVKFTKESVEADVGPGVGPRDAVERLGLKLSHKRRFDSNEWNHNGVVIECKPLTDNVQAKKRLMMPQAELFVAHPAVAQEYLGNQTKEAA